MELVWPGWVKVQRIGLLISNNKLQCSLIINTGKINLSLRSIEANHHPHRRK